MYNLLVKGGSWDGSTVRLGTDRVVSASYTHPKIRKIVVPNNEVDFEELIKLPTLFVEERSRQGQFAKIGHITDVREQNTSILIDYQFDGECQPIPEEVIMKLAAPLRIQYPSRGVDELSTTHWAVKDADLFRVLYNGSSSFIRMPTVFAIPQYQKVVEDTVSVMMPFAGFDKVYKAIEAASSQAEMSCNRADTVWDHSMIMQDVIALIDTCSIVICDCTGRNANVFYELGIAHALGKEVILITQSASDIPFDIAHFRHIRYLPNAEGLKKLTSELVSKINKINDDRS